MVQYLVHLEISKNLSHVLLTIHNFGPIGFLDLVDLTKLSKATVSKYLNTAKENNFVQEIEDQSYKNRTLKKYILSPSAKELLLSNEATGENPEGMFSYEQNIVSLYSNLAIDPYMIDQLVLSIRKLNQKSLGELLKVMSSTDFALAFFFIFSNLIENSRKFRINQQYFETQYIIKNQKYPLHQIIAQILDSDLGFYSFERFSRETKGIDYFFLSKSTPIGAYIFSKIQETIELEKIRQTTGSSSSYKEWNYFTGLINDIYADLESGNIVWPAIESPFKALLIKIFISLFFKQMKDMKLNPLYIRKQIGNVCFNLLPNEIKSHITLEPEKILISEENIYILQIAVETAKFLNEKLSDPESEDELIDKTIWIDFNSKIPMGFCSNCGEPIKIYQNKQCEQCSEPLDTYIKPDLTEIYKHRLNYLMNQMKYLYMQETTFIKDQDFETVSTSNELIPNWIQIVKNQDSNQFKRTYQEYGNDFLNFIIRCLLKETWEALDSKYSQDTLKLDMERIELFKIREAIINFISTIKKSTPSLIDVLREMLKELYENITKIDDFGSIYESSENLNEESLTQDQTESKLLVNLISKSIIIMGEFGSEQQIFEPLMLFLPIPQVKYFVYFAAAKANMLEMIRPTTTEIISVIFHEKYKNPLLSKSFPVNFIYLINAIHQFLDNEHAISNNSTKLTKKAPLSEYQPIFFFKWIHDKITLINEIYTYSPKVQKQYAQWFEIFFSILALIEKFIEKDFYYIKKEILGVNPQFFEVIHYYLKTKKNRKIELIFLQANELEPEDSPNKEQMRLLAERCKISD